MTIQRVISTSRLVRLEGTVAIRGAIYRGTSFYGAPEQQGGKGESGAGTGTKIMCIISGPDKPFFDIRATQCSFRNIIFVSSESPQVSGDNIAIKAIPTADGADVDFYVTDCGFHSWETCVDITGRTIYFKNNVVSASNVGVKHRFSGPYVGNEDLLTSNEYGNRAGIVQNNRFHAVKDCILIEKVEDTDGPLRGWIISDNQVDIGRTLVEAPNGMVSCIIANNSLNLPASGINYDAIKIDKRLNGVSITGNTITGQNSVDLNGSYTRRYRMGIFLNNLLECKDVVISGNTFTYTLESAILVESNDDITVEGMVVTNNSFNGINVSQTVNNLRAAYSTNLKHSHMVMIGNSITNHFGDHVLAGRDSSNQTFAHCQYALNSFSKTTDPVDGIRPVNCTGDMSNQSSSRRFANNGVLYSRINETVVWEHEREGSASGGTGMKVKNGNGDFILYCIPTGSDTGSFSPGSSAVSLGTNTRKWSQVFTDIVRTSNLTIQLDDTAADPLNPTTFDDSTEESVYSGAELNVKDVLLSILSRLDSLEGA